MMADFPMARGLFLIQAMQTGVSFEPWWLLMISTPSEQLELMLVLKAAITALLDPNSIAVIFYLSLKLF